MAQRQEIDRRAEHQPPADDGGLRQLQQGIEDRHRERNVVAAPERVVARRIDQLDQLAQLGDARAPGPGRRLGAAMDGDEADPQLVFQSQVHRSILRLQLRSAGQLSFSSFCKERSGRGIGASGKLVFQLV